MSTEAGDRDGEIGAEVFITEPTKFSPDVFGVGDVECRCGGLRYTNITGSPQCSLVAQCPSCLDFIEVVPRPAS